MPLLRDRSGIVLSTNYQATQEIGAAVFDKGTAGSEVPSNLIV